MILCHCVLVTDRAVRRAVAEGAMDLDDLAQTCGAGAKCGGCRRALRSLLEACSDGTDAATPVRVRAGVAA